MDNAQKAIMIGVGLFITIIIISVVLLITNLGTGMVDDARENLGNMSLSLQNTLKSSYDNKVVKGADVVSLYNQYKDDTSMMLVIEGNDEVAYAREANKIKKIDSTNYYEIGDGIAVTAKTSGITNLVNSSATYRTYLIKSGDTILGVYCDKQ